MWQLYLHLTIFTSLNCKWYVCAVQVECLQVDNDISKNQLSNMKSRLEQYNDTNEDDHVNNMKMLDSDQEKSVDSDNEGGLW